MGSHSDNSLVVLGVATIVVTVVSERTDAKMTRRIAVAACVLGMSACGAGLGRHAPVRVPAAGAPLSVASVWAVHLRRFCSKEVVRSIEAALRAYQSTRLLSMSHCFTKTEAELAANAGCAKHSRMEVITFTRPANFNYPGLGAPLAPRVYAIIASMRVPAGSLILDMGIDFTLDFAHDKPHRVPRVRFLPFGTPPDFMNLRDGECSPATVADVPEST